MLGLVVSGLFCLVFLCFNGGAFSRNLFYFALTQRGASHTRSFSVAAFVLSCFFDLTLFSQIEHDAPILCYVPFEYFTPGSGSDCERVNVSEYEGV